MKKTPTRALLITAVTVTLLLLSVVGLILFRPGTEYVTVTFETAGGAAIAPLRVAKGATLALPAAEKEGKTFRAWYYDEALTDKAPDSIRVTKDITLYARFGVTLTFDTQGGTPVSPVIYDEEAMFGSPAASYKTGFVFLGWFYDPGCTRKVWENDIFTSAATVYAGFSNEAGGTLRRTESVKGVSETPEIEITAADLQLHDGNLAEYISAVGADGDTVRLVCRPVSEGRYALRPYGTLQPGETYFVKALSSATSFVSVDGRSVGNADELSLVIYREAREVIEKKESRHVRNTDLAGYEENIYSYMDGELEKPVNRLIIRTDTPFAVGSLLTVGEADTPADGDYIGKIISAKTETMQFVIGGEIFSGVFAILEVITPNVDDVYGDLDIYGTGQAQLEGYISLSAEEVAQNVEDNEGMTRLREAVVQAVAQSQAVTEYAATLKTDAEKQIFMAALAGFSFEKPHVKVRISGTQLAF